MNILKNKWFVLSMCCLLSGCATDGCSYFVRFWNGNLPLTLSKDEHEVRDYCYKKTEHMPDDNYDNGKKAARATLECINQEMRKRNSK